MADPRFYSNRGPIRLAEICARLGLELPAAAGVEAWISDIATLDGAGPDHLAFCTGQSSAASLARSRAGFCAVDADSEFLSARGATLLKGSSPERTFAAVARLLYPEHARVRWEPIDPAPRLGEDVRIATCVAIGSGAEIGDRTRIGPSAALGPGVTVGRDCEIGANVTITHAHIGDRVCVLPGAQIGQAGFGFLSGKSGHTRMPQLGRVVVQDDVEIGACTTIDRGALGDTVIGEGAKIDNLVQIGHNTRLGRHCIVVAQVGISGSCELGEFVVLGGQVGLADHVKIGEGARLAARAAAVPGELPGGQDYGGVPARPIQQWRRELAAVALLGRRRKRDANG